MAAVSGAMTTGNILAAQLSPGLAGGRKKKSAVDTDGYVPGDEDADDKVKKRKGSGKALMAAVRKAAAAGAPTVNTSRSPL